MPDLAMLDYFYGDEAEQFTFYRIPKVLFTDPSYRRISSDAKILYGLCLTVWGCQFGMAGWTNTTGYSFSLLWRMLWNICAAGIPKPFPFLGNWIRRA